MNPVTCSNISPACFTVKMPVSLPSGVGQDTFALAGNASLLCKSLGIGFGRECFADPVTIDHAQINPKSDLPASVSSAIYRRHLNWRAIEPIVARACGEVPEWPKGAVC